MILHLFEPMCASAGEGREGIRMYRGDFEGIPLRLIDTPGLEVSQAEMGSNLERLGKIK